MVHGLHCLDLALWVIREYDLQRLQHRHASLGVLAQHLADTVLEHAHFDELVFLGHAAALHEVAQGGRRIAATAHA